MEDQSDRIADALRGVLRECLEHSPAVRLLATEVAHWVLSEAARLERQPAAEPPAPAGRPPVAASACVEAPGDGVAGTTSGVVSLKLGSAVAQVAVCGSREEIAAAEQATLSKPAALRPTPIDLGPAGTAAEVDLDLVVRRCRLKAESCRLYLEKRACGADQQAEAAVVERIEAALAQAKQLSGCFLWPLWRGRQPPCAAALETIAACYEALGGAAELASLAVRTAGTSADRERVDVLQTLATANSALRAALTATWLKAPDRDQDDVHEWLRRATSLGQAYVLRHMTLDDPADPTEISALTEFLAAQRERFALRKKRVASVDALFNRIRYHARRLPSEGVGDGHDFARIDAALDELAQLGVPRTDPRVDGVRALLAHARFPADRTRHAWLAAREEDAAEPDARVMPTAPRSGAWSPCVQSVRGLLAGGVMVVVGGEPRRDAIERLETAFALQRVEWVELVEHGPSEPLRAPIARPDTRVVVALVRLCGHLHVDEARRWARQCGKPLVMAPGGYNPEQLAEQILQQATERLREATAAGVQGV